MGRWILTLVLVCGAIACSRASNESKAHEWEEPLPAPASKGNVEVPDGVSITLSVDGTARPPITSESLRAAKPDFVDPERRAWLITTLIPDAVPGTVVEAGSLPGVSVRIQQPTPDGFVTVLFVTRRGDVHVSAVDLKDPFPRFHGQGGRLHRPGDMMPHAERVSRLEITRSAMH